MGNDNCETSEEKQIESGSVKSEEINNKNQSGMVSSLAEKAMSVAAPVVPTREDGAVDHDRFGFHLCHSLVYITICLFCASDYNYILYYCLNRLVTILSEWGQKGGMLRLVGKVALLWGGLRGAMSLTDRLISFLRIADRPLLHRCLVASFYIS